MAKDIKGFKIKGTAHKIDYNFLANLPGSPLPEVSAADRGKVLGVNTSGEWAAVEPSSDEQELPTVTTADSGKFLRVDSSGKWVAAEIPNAEEASF